MSEAEEIKRLSNENYFLQVELKQVKGYWNETSRMHARALTRAAKAEGERDKLRDALNQVGLDAEQKAWVENFLNRGKE